MKAIWIVRWRGMEESYPSRQDALDRQDQLDALGIEAELVDGAGLVTLPQASSHSAQRT